jgi:hypothetical protein
MPTLRIRLTGSRENADVLIAQLNGVENVERVEEVDDEIDDMRDDSTSLQLPDDVGSSVFRIEVEAPHAVTLTHVHDAVEIAARDLDAAVEFVDQF